jgi:hypothetical protein
MGDEYGLVVRFSLRPGCEAAFDQLVLETIAEIRQQEPETLLYSSHAVHGRPDRGSSTSCTPTERPSKRTRNSPTFDGSCPSASPYSLGQTLTS